MREFDLIGLLRARAGAARGDVALGIGDDAAVLVPPPGGQLVACTDTMVAGVHFLPDTPPADLGWKSLAVNLSDVAAMGAEPAWALLALTLPDGDANFVEAFADGFAGLARAHGVALVGGDTTQGPLSITVTVLGAVPVGTALTRGGAQVGDAVFVTGTLGDAAGGLRLLQDSARGNRDRERQHPPRRASHAFAIAPPFLQKGEEHLTHRSVREEAHPRPNEGGRRAAPEEWGSGPLAGRLRRPTPRIAAGRALRGVATACIDVSDGLVADLGHICDGSGVAAEIGIDALPLSAALAAAFDEATCRELAQAGGDDYELCFTVPESQVARIAPAFAALQLRVTRIGRVVAGAGVRGVDAAGHAVALRGHGWEHFSR